MFPLMQKLMTKQQQKQRDQAEMVGSKRNAMNAMSAMGRFSISPDLAWPKSINSLALTDLKSWKGLAPFPSKDLSSFLDPWKVVMHNGRTGCALDSAPETLEFPMHINTDFVRCHSEPAKSWAGA